jgi:hypothetical protein
MGFVKISVKIVKYKVVSRCRGGLWSRNLSHIACGK